MSDFYDKMADTSSRLLKKFGQDVFLIRPDTTIDPVTGTDTSGVDRHYLLTGLFKSYPDNFIDGTRIKASDRMIIMSGDFEPEISDKIKTDNQEWNIESIKTTNPAGTALIYFVQVRR